MEISSLRQQNDTIKELRRRIKQTNTRSVLELEEILSSVADRKAFILLLDSFETEKTITRDLLENLIDHTFEMNSEILNYMENEIDFSKTFTDIFSLTNIKSIIIFAIGIGIVISLSVNGELTARALNLILPAAKEAQ